MRLRMGRLKRHLNFGFVGYSPLGRGLLTGNIQSYEDLDTKDLGI